MQFFLDVVNGTFEMARAFLTFSADAQEAIADVAPRRHLRNRTMHGV